MCFEKKNNGEGNQMTARLTWNISRHNNQSPIRFQLICFEKRAQKAISLKMS